ncbi:hypothetical protein [uncultured Desulfuromusa sp.]|uniref:hypothetical protein n=1 Tax=uncultured Desulfuromusa sp. TaxID=219183 RepID=UPI002AA88E9D|nr:hypothetical protein [uncultured Desulfuromusa sp.]
MQKILDEIKIIPGVLGSAVYTSKRGILASNLPEVFKSDTQERIGNILHRVFKLNETVKLDVNSFEIQYDEALLLIRKLCDSSSLIFICEPDAKVHLINMSASMVTTDLLALISDCEEAPVATKAAPAPQEKTPAPAPAPPADLESVLNGALAEKFTQMKKLLAKHIGPVANKALKTSVKQWLEQGEASTQRLGELARIMQLEIDDQASRDEFLTDVKEVA